MKLTVDLVRDLANGVDIRQLKKLSATHMSITALDDIRQASIGLVFSFTIDIIVIYYELDLKLNCCTGGFLVLQSVFGVTSTGLIA